MTYAQIDSPKVKPSQIAVRAGRSLIPWPFVLTTLLVTAKQAGLVQIDWVWALFPLWCGPAVVLAIIAGILVVVILGAIGVGLMMLASLLIDAWRERQLRRERKLRYAKLL